MKYDVLVLMPTGRVPVGNFQINHFLIGCLAGSNFV